MIPKSDTFYAILGFLSGSLLLLFMAAPRVALIVAPILLVVLLVVAYRDAREEN